MGRFNSVLAKMRKYIAILIITLVGLTSCTGNRPDRIWPFAPDPTDPIHALLQQKVDVDFKDSSIEDVITYLRMITGINMLVTPRVMASPPMPVNITLKNVRLGTVILYIQQQTGTKIVRGCPKTIVS